MCVGSGIQTCDQSRVHPPPLTQCCCDWLLPSLRPIKTLMMDNRLMTVIVAFPSSFQSQHHGLWLWYYGKLKKSSCHVVKQVNKSSNSLILHSITTLKNIFWSENVFGAVPPEIVGGSVAYGLSEMITGPPPPQLNHHTQPILSPLLPIDTNGLNSYNYNNVHTVNDISLLVISEEQCQFSWASKSLTRRSLHALSSLTPIKSFVWQFHRL